MDNVENKVIPNRLQLDADSKTARKARATMSKDLWNEFLTKDQRKRGLGEKEIQAVLLSMAQQWNLKWSLVQVDFTK